MTRRSLLFMLAAAAGDPDRLIWQPGKKHYSIPAPRPPLPFQLVGFSAERDKLLALYQAIDHKWRTDPTFRGILERQFGLHHLVPTDYCGFLVPDPVSAGAALVERMPRIVNPRYVAIG